MFVCLVRISHAKRICLKFCTGMEVCPRHTLRLAFDGDRLIGAKNVAF